ncbi:hypothetical protein ACOMHN_057678 [Nucella lapillus]
MPLWLTATTSVVGAALRVIDPHGVLLVRPSGVIDPHGVADVLLVRPSGVIDPHGVADVLLVRPSGVIDPHGVGDVSVVGAALRSDRCARCVVGAAPQE